jgi:hypothetical protein
LNQMIDTDKETPRLQAVSIRQPWAWAILHAGKDIENRKRKWNHQGMFAIHAASKLDPFDGWPPGVSRPQAGALQLSAFVGVVDLMGMVDCSDSAWWRGGPLGWVLANPRPLPRPIPYTKGNSAIWNVPPAIARSICRQLGSGLIGGQDMAIASRLLTLTQGNLDNKYLSLAEVLDMFPEDVRGGSDAAQAAPRTVRVQYGNEVVETDIDATKNIFRKRGSVARFFDENKLQAGDRVLLKQVEPYVYHVSKA